MKNKISIKLSNLLKKDLTYINFALGSLENEIEYFEKEYSMSWKIFLDKFNKGSLGDDKVWFKWYGLAMSAKDWYEAKKEISETIGAT